MSTNDVPGANAANRDVLAAGAWAEHDDGSLLYVKGNESGNVVYELYDVAQQPPVSYQDAMREEAFKKSFSFPPVGTSTVKWTWHDKTSFPWSRVMKTFDKPRPVYADVRDQMTAAQQVAESLALRASEITEDSLEDKVDRVMARGRSIRDRIVSAVNELIR